MNVHRRRAATSLALVVCALSGCQNSGSEPAGGAHASEDWRAVANTLIEEVTEGGDTPQTLPPDPSLNEPPERDSALVFVPSAASDLEARLTPVAAEHDLEATCTTITRARALELLAEPADRNPNVPSSVCNLTRADERFGFFLFAARTEDTTTIWYELGPDAAPQTP